MAIDIEKYRAYLEGKSTTQRFRLSRGGEPYSIEDAAIMLEETYRNKVEIREREYIPEATRPIIDKVARWITGNHLPGLLLYGTIGSGKTTMADSIVKMISITSPSHRIRRYTAMDIAGLAQSDADKYTEVMTSEMLLIDDLGEEPLFVKNYGNEISPIARILYHRYDRRLFTIITTNLTMDEIRNTYGARIEHRFEETYDRLYFNIPSYRRNKK